MNIIFPYLVLTLLVSIIITLPFRYYVFNYLNDISKDEHRKLVFWAYLKYNNENNSFFYIFNLLIPSISILIYINNMDLILSFIDITVITTFISLALIDWHVFKLPDKLQIVVVFSVPVMMIVKSINFRSSLIGGGAGLLIGYTIVFVSTKIYKKTVFGTGDVKLLTVIGLVSGWPELYFIFFLGTFLATMYGLVNIRSKKLNWKSKIPLGAFLCIVSALFIILRKMILEKDIWRLLTFF